MANVKITDLTSGSALIGTELFEAVQTATSVKLTADQIKEFVLSNAYIQALSLVDQTAVANTPTAIKFGTTDTSNDISVVNDGSGNATKITFANAGLYDISVNLQMDNSAGSDYTVYIWLQKNGSDVANTTSIVSVPKASAGGTTIFELNTLFNAAAGDYIQYMWAPANAAVTLRYDAAQVSPFAAPAVPSAIFVATQVA